ncbi:MAG: hypothetical protein ACKVS8_07340 [Phycisphaerales bacterium]
MSHIKRSSLVRAAIVVSLAGSTALASVVVTSGLVDTSATALSRRKGSVAGPFTDDPAAHTGTSGFVEQSSSATAGPVGPIDDTHPSVPGTRGIVMAAGVASLFFVDTPSHFTIYGDAGSSNSFAEMDGGGYLGAASAYFRTEFTLDVAATYVLSGFADFNSEDPLASLFFVGPPGLIVLLTAGNNGEFLFSGALPAGNYYLEGFAGVNEVPEIGVGADGEIGEVSAVLSIAVPAPGAAALLGAAGLLARRRR